MSSIRDHIVEYLVFEETLFADGFDDAIVGFEPSTGKVIYSIEAMTEILVSEGMSIEDAVEHLDFNVIGAYVGEFTPIYIYTFPDV